MKDTELPKEEIFKIIKDRLSNFLNADKNYKLLILDHLPIYSNFMTIEEIDAYLLQFFINNIKILNAEMTYSFISSLVSILQRIKDKTQFEIIHKKFLILLEKILDETSCISSTIVRFSFEKLISFVIESLRDEKLCIEIISLILSTSNRNDKPEVFRIECMFLIMKFTESLIQTFDTIFCEKFIVPQLLLLLSENHSSIKQKLCKILPKISKKVSFEYHSTKIRSLFLGLLNDKDSKVRISAISCFCSLMKDNQEKSNFVETNKFFIDLFEKLMIDYDKKIRIAVFEIFGEFIQLLAINELGKKYIEYYKNTINEFFFYQNNFQNTQNKEKENELNILIIGAKNFNTVLMKYGLEYWELLLPIYKKLICFQNFEVTIELLKKFDELCTFGCKENTKKDLIEIYDSFLNSKNLKISSFAEKILLKFLRFFNQNNDIKMKYIEYIKSEFKIEFDYQKIIKTINQREDFGEREIKNIIYFKTFQEQIKFCKNCVEYCDLFSIETLIYCFSPIIINLCLNKVYKVRKEASIAAGKILKIFYKSNRDLFFKIIKGFAFSTKSKNRIEFVLIAETIIEDKDIFNEIYIYILHSINDKNLDVRIITAELINKIWLGKKNKLRFLLKEEKFNSLISQLIKEEELKNLFNFSGWKESENNIVSYNEEKELYEKSDDFLNEILKMFGIELEEF